MADAFTTGAKRAGHTVERFASAEKTIKWCIACNQCFKKGTACVFSDDFNELAAKIENIDVIAFATPLYWFNFPVQMKAAIDKFYSFMIAQKPFVKESVLMVCGEDDRTMGFDGIVKTYDLMVDYLKWNDLGKLIVTNVFHKGDIEKTDGLKRAEQLGESIA
jgi:multimeric flavodoxin WrbA